MREEVRKNLELWARQQLIAMNMGIDLFPVKSDIEVAVERQQLLNRHAGKINFVKSEYAQSSSLGGKWVRDDVAMVNKATYKGQECLVLTQHDLTTYILREDGYNAKISAGCDSGSWRLLDVNNSGNVGIKPTFGAHLTSISMERIMLLAYSKMLGILPEDIDAVDVNCMDLGGTKKTLKNGRVINRNFKLSNLEFCIKGVGGLNNLHKEYWFMMLDQYGVCTKFSIYDPALYSALGSNGWISLQHYAQAHAV